MSKKRKALNQRSSDAQAQAAEASKSIVSAQSILVKCQAAHQEQLRVYAGGKGEEGRQVSARPIDNPDILRQLKVQVDCLRKAKQLHVSLKSEHRQVRW